MELIDWNYKEDKVEYLLSDNLTVTLDRDLFRQHCLETDFYTIQVAEDDFKPYTPTEQEYLKDEKEFFNNYFKEELPIKCKHIKREGESCTLNNNCTYPNCK